MEELLGKIIRYVATWKERGGIEREREREREREKERYKACRRLLTFEKT